MKQAKFKAKQKKKDAKKKQHRANKISYRILITGIVLFSLLTFFSPRTIGYDSGFMVFILLLPVAIGVLLLLIYQKKITDALIGTSNYVETLWEKILFQAFYIVAAAFFSFFTLSVPVQIGFETISFYTASGNRQETILLPVKEFHKKSGSRGSNRVYFYFNGRSESIGVSKETINRYISESATKHRIKLKIRKGLWNHYIVDEWDIVI